MTPRSCASTSAGQSEATARNSTVSPSPAIGRDHALIAQQRAAGPRARRELNAIDHRIERFDDLDIVATQELAKVGRIDLVQQLALVAVPAQPFRALADQLETEVERVAQHLDQAEAADRVMHVLRPQFTALWHRPRAAQPLPMEIELPELVALEPINAQGLGADAWYLSHFEPGPACRLAVAGGCATPSRPDAVRPRVAARARSLDAQLRGLNWPPAGNA